mgnify:CR=1 FL=1
MIEMRLYGTLRRYGPTGNPRVECVVQAEAAPGDETVRDLLAGLGIPPGEVASVFINGRWTSAGVDAPIAGVTRLGLFPAEMSLLYV